MYDVICKDDVRYYGIAMRILEGGLFSGDAQLILDVNISPSLVTHGYQDMNADILQFIDYVLQQLSHVLHVSIKSHVDWKLPVVNEPMNLENDSDRSK